MRAIPPLSSIAASFKVFKIIFHSIFMPVFELVLKKEFTGKDVHTIIDSPCCTYGGWRSDGRGPVLRVIYHDPDNVPDLSQYAFIERVEEGGL